MLFVIPTPIGNLDDITLRAIKTIADVEYLLVEDSRVTGKLLKKLELEKKMIPFHSFNEHRKLDGLLKELEYGRDIGLISDAGSPGISDPGFLLIRECREKGIAVTTLPGPSAVTTAVTTSGLPSDKFYFEGFLPHKKGRKKRLEHLASLPETFILFESPFRIKKCLDELSQYCGPNRQAAICRELTKMHEEVNYGSLDELTSLYSSISKPRGEFVIVVGGNC